MRAITRPAALSALASTYKFEEQKFKGIVDTLIRDGLIKGKVQQGGVYTPTSFTLMQETAVRSFYSQNRYLEYSMLSKL